MFNLPLPFPCPPQDCDNDSDCSGSLKCWQRNAGEKIRGCDAGGTGDEATYDYCYNDKTVLTNQGDTTIADNGGTGAECYGDCDADSDCTGDLKCRQRDNNEKIPGCDNGGSGDVTGYDYCHSPRTTLTIKGDTRVTPENSGGECEGECDTDNDCSGSLKCWQRTGTQKIRGCDAGGSDDVSGFDYCYNVNTVLTNQGDTTLQSAAGEACTGDCDSDSDCTGGLKCYERHNNEAIPGCVMGGANDIKSHDYCYNAKTEMKNVGDTRVTPDNPGEECEGDCKLLCVLVVCWSLR